MIKKTKWFKVKYSDGDAEQVNLSELKNILIHTKDKPLKKKTTEIRRLFECLETAI